MKKHNLPIKIELPEHFLNEEVRDGYMVTSKVKKIWAVELDLLVEFARVCDKYHLQWFVSYGSLLGVIRHRGFIPWDNDIDINITRESFKKLCEVAPTEFKHPYFLQTPVSENGRYFKIMAKFCNSETTGASEMEWLQGINCGLFIDIFVLDEIPEDDKKVKQMFDTISYYRHFERFFSPYKFQHSGLKSIKNLIWKILWKVEMRGRGGDEIFSRINAQLESYRKYNCDRWMALEVTPERSVHFPKALWTKNIMMDFEFIKVPVPDCYDYILRDHYGDYMQLPPIENRVNHEYLNLEPEIPFVKYFSK